MCVVSMDKYLNQNLMQASNLLSKGNINAAINIFDTLSYKYPKNGDVMHESICILAI